MCTHPGRGECVLGEKGGGGGGGGSSYALLCGQREDKKGEGRRVGGITYFPWANEYQLTATCDVVEHPML